MRTKEQNAYVRKMEAWFIQQDISVSDSMSRIEYAQRQIKNNIALIQCEREQIKIDKGLKKAEAAKFNRWLAKNK